MPPRARWHQGWTDEEGKEVPPLKHLKADIGSMLKNTIAAIEEENNALAGVLKNNIDFNAVKGKSKIPDQKWKDLLDHSNQPQIVLVNDNFELPDLLGAAYEYLIKYFADSAGKKGGEFYNPAKVVRFLFRSPSRKPVIPSTIPQPVPAVFSSRPGNTSKIRGRIRTTWPSMVRIPTARSPHRQGAGEAGSCFQLKHFCQ